MEIREYQKLSTRTLDKNLDFHKQLNNMLLGISGETGETIDLFKKHLYQGHRLDNTKVSLEIGDIMFYLTNLCTLLEINMEDVLEINVHKLRNRYPNGFEAKRSVDRWKASIKN